MKSKHTLLLERVYNRLSDVREQTSATVHRDNPNLTSIGYHAALKPGIVLAEPPDLVFGEQSTYLNSGYARSVSGRIRLHLFLSGDGAHANIEKAYAHLGVSFKHARLKSRRVRLLDAKTIRVEQQ